MTRAYSIAFKQKMVQRLAGRNFVSAAQLCRETGVRQQNLSRWLTEARSLPLVATDKPTIRQWTVEQKARVLARKAFLSLITWLSQLISRTRLAKIESIKPPEIYQQIIVPA